MRHVKILKLSETERRFVNEKSAVSTEFNPLILFGASAMSRLIRPIKTRTHTHTHTASYATQPDSGSTTAVLIIPTKERILCTPNKQH